MDMEDDIDDIFNEYNAFDKTKDYLEDNSEHNTEKQNILSKENKLDTQIYTKDKNIDQMCIEDNIQSE